MSAAETPIQKTESAAAVILETVKDNYFAQERRHQSLISKTQTLATIATIVLTGISAALTAGTNIDFHQPLLWLSGIFSLLGVILCLLVLVSQNFERVHYEAALNDTEMNKPAHLVMGNLAKTYAEAARNSEPVLGKLQCRFDSGIWCLIASIILGALSIFINSRS